MSSRWKLLSVAAKSSLGGALLLLSAGCMTALQQDTEGAAPQTTQAPPPAPPATLESRPAPAAPASAGAQTTTRGISAPAGATRSAAALPTAEPPEDVRLFALTRGGREPRNSIFYGYIVIGPGVAPERKAAVFRAFACRVDAVTSVEQAEAIDGLGVMVFPSATPLDKEILLPSDILTRYDFTRAGRWLGAVDTLADDAIDSENSILFLGSRVPRANELDADAILYDIETSDPVIADASALSPRYLERWAFEIIQNVKQGEMRSRADLQTLMEIHSWIEVIGGPFAQILRITEVEASDFEAPTCL